MWETIARLRVRPDVPDEYFLAQLRAVTMDHAPGWLSTQLLRSDEDPRELWLVALFTDQESYRANVESDVQHAIYPTLRAVLDEDPEWHDVAELVSISREARSSGPPSASGR